MTNQKLSQTFIINLEDFVFWSNIMRFQKLSDNFCETYCHEVVHYIDGYRELLDFHNLCMFSEFGGLQRDFHIEIIMNMNHHVRNGDFFRHTSINVIHESDSQLHEEILRAFSFFCFKLAGC